MGLCLFTVLILPLFSEYEFQVVEKWNIKQDFIGYVCFSMIDKDGHVVGLFHKGNPILLTPQRVVNIADWGQGPNEISDMQCFLDLGEDIGLLELPTKLQVYSKKGDQYSWKKNLSFKQPKLSFVIKSGIFYDRKYFFAGWGVASKDNFLVKSYNLEVFNENGQPIKNLIFQDIAAKERRQVQFMAYHIAAHKGFVYYMPEYEFTVSVISAKDVAVVKTGKLAPPSFYKPLPDDFYSFKKVAVPAKDLLKNLDYWAVGYSRISRIAIDGGNLVLQARTCDPKLKKFCLMFYDVNTFKLVNQIFTDDYFLGVRNGKYYFFAGGDPEYDELEEYVIYVYQFKEKKN